MPAVMAALSEQRQRGVEHGIGGDGGPRRLRDRHAQVT
jgi:hypothetical protein